MSGPVHFDVLFASYSSSICSKLARKIQLPVFGDGLVVNAARCDPRNLVEGNDITGHKYLMYQVPEEDSPSAVAFGSFGRITGRSTTQEPAAMGAGTWASRGLHLAPVDVEWQRVTSVTHIAFNYAQLAEVSYGGGLSFSTRVATYVPNRQ